MSQSRFVYKQFASLDLDGGNLSGNNNSLEYIRAAPPSIASSVPVFTDESGINVSVSPLSVEGSNNMCLIGPTVVEGSAEGILLTSGSSAMGVINANPGMNLPMDITYLQAPVTFMSCTALMVPQASISQATNITTGVSASANPVIKIQTQTTSIAANGGSASFVVTGATTYLTTPFANVTVIPTVTSYAGSAIPYIIVSGYTNTTFTLKIFNLHPTNTLTQTMEISCTVLTNAALITPP